MIFPRMKEIRENAGLKQKDIAEVMGVSKGSYSMWECGTDTIPLKRLNQFCNYFNVSIDYVVGFNNKKKYANQKPDIKIKVTGENLKKIRLKKGLTQVQISSELKINQPTWNRYENAKNLILTKEEVISIFSTSFVLSSPLIITISIGFLALNI